jgi:hypothetical protein
MNEMPTFRLQEHEPWQTSNKKRRGIPGVHRTQRNSRISSAPAESGVQQPPSLPQCLFDLGKIANSHDLEEQTVNLGFEILQGYGLSALSATPDRYRSRGLLRRSSSFLASVW